MLVLIRLRDISNCKTFEQLANFLTMDEVVHTLVMHL